MKFTQLKIENFLTVGLIEADLSDKGLVLICGENLDDTSQDSNGSGKSSFVDALCWALYGSTARGISGDSVINDAAGKNCRVTVSLDIDGDTYVVARHRKYTKQKNRLIVTAPDGADLTLGTDKLTQEVVDKLMGATADVFCASVYSGQENTPDLPGMTDINLKAIVEEAAGINQLEAAHRLAKDRKNLIQKSLDLKNTDFSFQEKRSADLQDDLAEAIDKGLTWGDNQALKIASARDELVKAKKINDKGQSEDSVHRSHSAIDAELKVLVDQLGGRALEDSKLKLFEKIANDFKFKLSVLKSEAQVSVRKVKVVQAEISNVDNKMGEDCGECGRAHDASTLGSALNSLKFTLLSEINSLRDLKASIGLSTQAHQTAQDKVSKFTATLTDVSVVIAAQSVLHAEKVSTSAFKQSLENNKADFKRTAVAYKKIIAEENPHSGTVATVEERVEKCSDSMASIKGEIIEIEYNLELAEAAVHVFGPAGVRAHILDNVTPMLNEKTSEYLTILSDGNIQAVWNTLGTTSKGDIREKFNIEVSSSTGGDSFRKLSGGEKRKVRLATSMALQDLVSSRATKPIDLFVADEVDAAIDESGLERLMMILKDKADQVGTVLVISHSDLKSWISNSVTVVKEGGIARLQGHAL